MYVHVQFTSSCRWFRYPFTFLATNIGGLTHAHPQCSRVFKLLQCINNETINELTVFSKPGCDSVSTFHGVS